MLVKSPEAKPLAVFPLQTRTNASLHLFHGFPDEQPWLEEALRHVSDVAQSDAAALQELGPLSWGAPLGAFAEESMRVARVTGVVTEPGEEDAMMVGGVLAHARCWAYWNPAIEDDRVLTLEFQAPKAFGWGAGKDRMAQEQLRALCLRQLPQQVTSLLENVADAHGAARMEVSFTGNWDESTEIVRERLTAHALKVWFQQTAEGLVTAPAPLVH